MTILITGATGTIGRHLVHQLTDAGHPVRALTRNPTRADLPDSVDVVAGDLTDPDTLTGVFEGVTAAHLITFGGDNGEPLTTGPQLVQLATRAGVRRVTVLGGWEETTVEPALRDSDLDWTVLSLSEFMSGALEWAGSVRDHGAVRLLADWPSAVVHDADIAAVAAAVLTQGGHAGRTYPITGPQALAPAERTRLIGRAIGRQITFERLTEDQERDRLRSYGYAEDYLEFGIQLATNPPPSRRHPSHRPGRHRPTRPHLRPVGHRERRRLPRPLTAPPDMPATTTSAVRTVTDAERRARLARPHHVAPQHRAPDALTAARDMVALHATDPSTVFLSCHARVEDVAVTDVRRALEHNRTLVKDLAMRRTVFALPQEALDPVQAAVGDRVARAEAAALVRDVERHELHSDGRRWLDAATAQVLTLLADGRPRSSVELREELPILAGSYPQGAGTTWQSTVAIGPRVLAVLSARGLIVRGPSECHWRVPRHRWVRTEAWTAAERQTWTERDGATWLVERWLRAFGPGTEHDLKWWTGTTLGLVRRALADIHAVEVATSDGPGWLLPDDLDPEPDVEPWGALLPPLDPTTMGWRQRGWYLGDERAADLVDSAGNAGPTAWWDGRVVGGWRQNEHGVVELQGLEDVGSQAREALEQEAERVTEWCAGVRVMLTHPTPLARRLAPSD